MNKHVYILLDQPVVTTALQAAVELAEQISAFPQQCLRADRSSAIYSSYDAPSFTQVQPRSALTGEFKLVKLLEDAVKSKVNKTFLSLLFSRKNEHLRFGDLNLQRIPLVHSAACFELSSCLNKVSIFATV